MKKYTFNIIDNSENIYPENKFLGYPENPIFLNGKIQLCKFEYPLFLPENTSIKFCKIDDINNSENFFLFIEHKTNYIKFSEDIKNAISKNNNLKILFISPHESPINLEEFVKTLSNTIKNNNWKEENFFIINNNSCLNEIKKKFNSNINFYKINSLLRVISTMIKPTICEKDILFDKKFIFLCLNRNPNANHRIALLTYLKNFNLLENNITDWSWATGYGSDFKKIQSIQHLKKYIPYSDKNLIENYLEIAKQKKLSYYEKNIDWFDNREYFWSPEHHTLKTFQNSYINILTETEFDFIENSISITEKTFKPFYYFQMPIFVAAYNHVKMIRNEYNLNLFDDLIDHSYDDEKDDRIRFNMVVSEIKRLSNMRDEISLYYKNNVDKLIHNHNFIKNYAKQKNEENYFFNLMNENR